MKHKKNLLLLVLLVSIVVSGAIFSNVSFAEKASCLASEEIIKDLENREKSLREREQQLIEREKELETQKGIVQQEVKQLEVIKAEIQGIKAAELAGNEERVNRLVETFESMSPKAAAAVIGKIDEELATLTLSRLPPAKTGKILGALDPAKSSKLSEMIAYGRDPNKRKEKDRADQSQRAPASQR